ncbi:molybdopterin oxidoreductase family protein [Sporichthya brevicatena]|uniref:Molybdopterin oxidoreductase family protein n=1 Tax=Sporichthya brevicatena TaxID=171442 RepID=A0ABN1HC00_9ACTN
MTERQATCPICEAACGLTVTLDGADVVGIRGDADHPRTRGFVCPKGVALKELHHDPDRLRRPLVRRGGELVEVSWPEAFARLEELLGPVVRAHGPDAVAFHLGNPLAHDFGSWIYGWHALKLFGARQVYTTATVDHMPMMTAAALMFGARDTATFTIPTPDIDHCDLLVLLGTNPLVSNATGITAPRGRLAAIQQRGGRIVVVDPARTRTAELADEHLAIRPGGDAALLAALITTIVADGRAAELPEHYAGLDDLVGALAPFTPERVAERTGVPADRIRALAAEIAATERVAFYGRVGAMVQPFGSLTCWLLWTLAAVTGNLDRPGGLLFPQALAATHATRGRARYGDPVPMGRWTTPDGSRAEVLGELPVAALPDAILTSGQIRALITMGSNGARSTPDSARYEQALDAVDVMVSVDPYLNETTRHADLILPPPSALERDHFDYFFDQIGSHNYSRWTDAVVLVEPDRPTEHDLLLELVRVLAGLGPIDRAQIDGLLLSSLVHEVVDEPGSVVADRDPHDLLAALGDRPGPERGLDLMIRIGPYGDRFGERPDGMTLARLRKSSYGVDLGPLQPRLPDVLRTPSGAVELAPAPLVADLPRLERDLDAAFGLRLIGRRQTRSNNSWLHNAPSLMRGSKERCTLLVHPKDAAPAGLADGDLCRLSSAAGSVVVPVQISEAIRPGVVSLPHGWGHDGPGLRLAVASAHPGANLNAVTGPAGLDVPSGNAALNGTEVRIAPAG